MKEENIMQAKKINTLYELAPKSHSGWKQDEEDLLFKEVEAARSVGKPLKSVFDGVAKRTNRKPNSIRNYYYMRIKEDDARAKAVGYSTTFTPFSDEEVEYLLRTVLTEQSKGVSVRACTLKMGNNDNKAMLRFQNKYRSLIKTSPELVKSVIDELRKEGANVFDPYTNAPVHKAGRPKKAPESLVDIIASMVNDLNRVEGLDVVSFFENLGALAVGASAGTEAIRRLEQVREADTGELIRLRDQNVELKERLICQGAEMASQRERFNTLLGLFRQLMNVNRDFLSMTSVVKMSSLANYIKVLSRNVEDCEKLMLEYIN